MRAGPDAAAYVWVQPHHNGDVQAEMAAFDEGWAAALQRYGRDALVVEQETVDRMRNEKRIVVNGVVFYRQWWEGGVIRQEWSEQ